MNNVGLGAQNQVGFTGYSKNPYQTARYVGQQFKKDMNVVANNTFLPKSERASIPEQLWGVLNMVRRQAAKKQARLTK